VYAKPLPTDSSHCAVTTRPSMESAKSHIPCPYRRLTESRREEEVGYEDIGRSHSSPFHETERKRSQGCRKYPNRQCCLDKSANQCLIYPALLTPAPSVFGAATGTAGLSWVSCFSTSVVPVLLLLFKSIVEKSGMLVCVHGNLHAAN